MRKNLISKKIVFFILVFLGNYFSFSGTPLLDGPREEKKMLPESEISSPIISGTEAEVDAPTISEPEAEVNTPVINESEGSAIDLQSSSSCQERENICTPEFSRVSRSIGMRDYIPGKDKQVNKKRKNVVLKMIGRLDQNSCCSNIPCDEKGRSESCQEHGNECSTDSDCCGNFCYKSSKGDRYCVGEFNCRNCIPEGEKVADGAECCSPYYADNSGKCSSLNYVGPPVAEFLGVLDEQKACLPQITLSSIETARLQSTGYSGDIYDDFKLGQKLIYAFEYIGHDKAIGDSFGINENLEKIAKRHQELRVSIEKDFKEKIAMIEKKIRGLVSSSGNEVGDASGLKYLEYMIEEKGHEAEKFNSLSEAYMELAPKFEESITELDRNFGAFKIANKCGLPFVTDGHCVEKCLEVDNKIHIDSLYPESLKKHLPNWGRKMVPMPVPNPSFPFPPIPFIILPIPSKFLYGKHNASWLDFIKEKFKEDLKSYAEKNEIAYDPRVEMYRGIEITTKNLEVANKEYLDSIALKGFDLFFLSGHSGGTPSSNPFQLVNSRCRYMSGNAENFKDLYEHKKNDSDPGSDFAIVARKKFFIYSIQNSMMLLRNYYTAAAQALELSRTCLRERLERYNDSDTGADNNAPSGGPTPEAANSPTVYNAPPALPVNDAGSEEGGKYTCAQMPNSPGCKGNNTQSGPGFEGGSNTVSDSLGGSNLSDSSNALESKTTGGNLSGGASSIAKNYATFLEDRKKQVDEFNKKFGKTDIGKKLNSEFSDVLRYNEDKNGKSSGSGSAEFGSTTFGSAKFGSTTFGSDKGRGAPSLGDELGSKDGKKGEGEEGKDGSGSNYLQDLQKKLGLGSGSSYGTGGRYGRGYGRSGSATGQGSGSGDKNEISGKNNTKDGKKKLDAANAKALLDKARRQNQKTNGNDGLFMRISKSYMEHGVPYLIY